ncbi:hypothetical protein MMC29_004664 [Sticta canariensis]|nr:hypothetical protein [Sticta canariensis]
MNKFLSQLSSRGYKLPSAVLSIHLFWRKTVVRNNLFVARVVIEFKTAINTKDAIIQLINSISKKYGANFKSKGFLIGVKAHQWTIMNYNLVTVQGIREPLCLIHNFHEEQDGDMVKPVRPTPSRQYREFDSMDLKSKDETSDLLKALD